MKTPARRATLFAVALGFTVAGAAFGGCLCFTKPKPGSACAQSSEEILWLNPPASPETADPQPYGQPYHSTYGDPSFVTGVFVNGSTRFDFRAKGRFLVEFFLAALDAGHEPFVLEANGRAVDDSYRETPGQRRRKWRNVTPMAVVEGGTTLAIATPAPRYLLKAIRWTAVEEFERKQVPLWLNTARTLFANPIYGIGEGIRRDYLEQLTRPLTLSRRPEIHREGIVGLTRAVYWLGAEEAEPRELARLPGLFAQALRVAPGDRILQQTVSAACLATNHPQMPKGPYCEQVRPVPWSLASPVVPEGAPQWAVEQRKLLARMDALTQWWVDHRLQPNGEIGGGWGDDVEILRRWGPQALGLGSAVAVRALKGIAEGIWASGLLLNGYAKRISDAEHSAEPTTDSQPLLAATFPDDPRVIERLRETAGCAKHWIARQPDGRWRFRGAWFNCQEVDPKPERAIDVHYNVRAMGPALWYAYLTRDPDLVELLSKWAASWVEAMRSTQHGKPAGLFPSTVKSADGSYLVASDRWDKPNAEWDYFQWSGGSQEALTSLVLGVYDLTGDRKWLQAAGESFQILDHCGGVSPYCEQIRRSPQAFYEWRRHSGNARYDTFFGYAASRDESSILDQMASQARQEEARLSVNFDMQTTEVLFTDRFGYGPGPEYLQHLFGGDAPRGERYPTFRVTWPAAEADFARAVVETAPDRLKLRLYNFAGKEHSAPLRLWRLESGRYIWESRDSGGRPLASGEAVISQRAQVIRLPLPARQEVSLTLRRAR